MDLIAYAYQHGLLFKHILHYSCMSSTIAGSPFTAALENVLCLSRAGLWHHLGTACPHSHCGSHHTCSAACQRLCDDQSLVPDHMRRPASCRYVAPQGKLVQIWTCKASVQYLHICILQIS